MFTRSMYAWQISSPQPMRRLGLRRSKRKPSANSRSAGDAGKPAGPSARRLAAKSARRDFNRDVALRAAAPLRSVPDDAAVGEVLLFFSVLVEATKTWS